MEHPTIGRREFCKALTAGAALAAVPGRLLSGASSFKLRYILASCMYGTTPLAEILPEVRKTGAESIDIWPRVHGNQREQIEEMGHDQFRDLLQQHRVTLEILTRYDLGPFKLQEEMQVARKLGARVIVTGSRGPRNVTGIDLKRAVREFAQQMKPHLAVAEETGVTIGIENHGKALIESYDSMLYLAEYVKSKHLGIALAPYHLRQDPNMLARLIANLGDRLVHFYAWEHGQGCMTKLPKNLELLQMPGRGVLDFKPILAALKKIDYHGGVSIFMHPYPRGIPILDTTEQVTAEVNRARAYLEDCLR